MHDSRELLHQIPDLIRNVGVHTARQGDDHPLHQDSFWELMYMRSGHIVCVQGENEFPLHPGMAILHPPRVSHADIATTAYKTYYIWIDAPEEIAWPRLCYDDEYKSLERICHSLLLEWRGEDAERSAMLAFLSAELSVLLKRAAESVERTSGEVATALAEQIIEAEYSRSLTIEEIARHTGVSKSSLYEHFARLRGQTPMDYLQEVRLRHALSHLRHSTRTLEVIADLCGYHSASHLSRHVKAATGKTPGSLRKG